MEILGSFNSIYCFISFIFGAIFMLAMLSIVAIGKTKEPKNKVHFYIKLDSIQHLPYLYIKDLGGVYHCLCSDKRNFSNFGLNYDDFANIRIGEIREVFLNLEN